MNSLVNKLDFVRGFIGEAGLDIVVVGETWLTPDVGSSYVSIPGFNIVRGDTNSGSY